MSHCARLGFCKHFSDSKGFRVFKTPEDLPLCNKYLKPSPGFLLQESRQFAKGYKSPDGTPSINLLETPEKDQAFRDMVDAFFNANDDLRKRYWPFMKSSEGVNISKYVQELVQIERSH